MVYLSERMLNRMRYKLTREGDGAGDSGPMSLGIHLDKDEKPVFEDNARPQIGKIMRVGTFMARSYQNQDWWQTTPVTEILEESENIVRFKTKNSVYTWEVL